MQTNHLLCFYYLAHTITSFLLQSFRQRVTAIILRGVLTFLIIIMLNYQNELKMFDNDRNLLT